MESVFLFIQRIQESYLHVEWRILLFALSGNMLCKELPLRRTEFRRLLMANASILSLPTFSATQSCLCSVVRCCFSSSNGDFARIKINKWNFIQLRIVLTKDRNLSEIAWPQIRTVMPSRSLSATSRSLSWSNVDDALQTVFIGGVPVSKSFQNQVQDSRFPIAQESG